MINLTDEELCMLEQLTYLDEDVAAAAGVNNRFGKINKKMKEKSISKILSVFDDEALLRLASHPESICDAEISGLEWVQIISYIKSNEKLSNLRLVDLYTTEDYKADNDNIYHGAIYDEDINKYVCVADYKTYVYDAYHEKYIHIADYRIRYSGKYIDPESIYVKTKDGDFVPYDENSSTVSARKIDINDVDRYPLGLCFVDDSDPHSAIIAYKGTTGQDEWSDNVEAANIYATEPQHEALNFAAVTVLSSFATPMVSK